MAGTYCCDPPDALVFRVQKVLRDDGLAVGHGSSDEIPVDRRQVLPLHVAFVVGVFREAQGVLETLVPVLPSVLLRQKRKKINKSTNHKKKKKLWRIKYPVQRKKRTKTRGKQTTKKRKQSMENTLHTRERFLQLSVEDKLSVHGGVVDRTSDHGITSS